MIFLVLVNNFFFFVFKLDEKDENYICKCMYYKNKTNKKDSEK